MKSYRGSAKKLMSYEYAKASTKLDRTQRIGFIKPTLSIRSITPDGWINKKEGKKHQCSFSYVPKTKTPAGHHKIKQRSNYNYLKSNKGSKSSDKLIKRNQAIISKTDRENRPISTNSIGIKFSSRNSKQNTNNDTV